MKNCKAQAAVELISTYGWVVLMGIGGMVILSQMGTFNPTSCSKTSSGFSQLVPVDWSVFVNSNALIIYVQNWAGDTVEVTSVNLSMSSGVQCVVETHVQIEPGSNSSLILQCSESLADSGKFKSGDCYTGELALVYTNVRSGNSDVSRGKIRGSIEGMNICYRSSQACFVDSDCCSGSCKTDYETSDKWCVGDSTQCVHKGIVYDNGANAQACFDAGNRRYCNAGAWNVIGCGTDGCSGVCGSGLNGCVWNDVSCSGGSCGSMPSDVDSSKASCDSCVGAGKWSVGGEVAATTCCGDDAGEYYGSRIADASMDNGYGSSPADHACCASALECVDDGACYPSGTSAHDADGDGDNDYCDSGTWKDCQTASQCGAAAPVCIAGDCKQCTLDQHCGLCQKCVGGACVFQTSSEDLKTECSSALGACASDYCNGAGACGYLSGKQACSACKQCSGSAYSCSNVAADSDPNADCSGDCDECDGAGVCRGDNSRCSGSAASCFCSGSGNSYSCQTCPDSFGQCGVPTCTGNVCGNFASSQGTDCGGLCQSCDGVGGCFNTSAGLDYQNECAASWTGCSGLCVKTGADGNCNGLGSCNAGGASANVVAGNICSAGSEIAGACNTTWACSSAQNTDGAYNNAGSGYWTQGTCDGGGVCDRSGAQGNGDDSSTSCSCIKGAGYWGLGGEVSSATCCEDAGEYKKTRSCTSGCTSDGTDDACCDANTDCSYTSTCYSSGSCSGTLKCSSGSWVNHCTDGVQDCDEVSPDCGGASCLKANAQSCTLGTECCSGICSYGVCCSATECGWGTECVANGGTRSNVWLNGVCRSGTWKAICGGVGCGSFACDSGTCDNNYCCRLGQLHYRKPVTVQELSGSALTNFPVMITTNTATLVSGGKMRSDCGDMRFTDNDGTTQLSYWVETGCNTASTVIWVKVPSLSASASRTIYMYYGNAALTSLSDGSGVFTFFDNFDDGSLARWTITGGSYGTYTAASDQKFSGGYSAKGTDSSTSGYPCITRANPLGGSFVNELRTRFSNTLKHFPWSWVSSAGCNTNWFMAYTASHWMYVPEGCYALNFPNDRTWTTNTWYKVKLAYNSATRTYQTWVDGNYLGQVAAQCGVTPTCVANTVTSLTTMRSCPGTLSESGGVQWVDDFIVRQFATTDPSTSAGSEEAY